MEMATITRQAEWMLECARGAKAARDADGDVSPKQDAQLARMEAGDFGGLIITPGPVTGLTRPDGQQGEKPEIVARVENGKMIGERPAGGGKGHYGNAKQVIASKVSPAQLNYITGLIEETTRYDATAGATAQNLYDTVRNSPNGLTPGRDGTASSLITALIGIRDTAKEKAPAKPKKTFAPLPKVIDGYYAIPGADGTLKFYRVKNHKNGRVYVDVQASDAWYNVNFGAYRTILAAIAADPEVAGFEYADKLGRCYRCNRTLTDDASRARRMGPDCANK